MPTDGESEYRDSGKSSGPNFPIARSARDTPAKVRADSTGNLSKDDIFEILRNSRRRSVLRLLADWDGQGTTGELAEHIAAEENDVTIQELASNQRKRVYIVLYQGHLPKLADYGVVTYDQARGTAELTEAADVLFPYLELGQERSADGIGDGRRSLTSVIRRWLMPWR